MSQNEDTIMLTHSELEDLLDRAATKAVIRAKATLFNELENELYKRIGKAVVARSLILLGMLATYFTWYFHIKETH